MYSHQAKFISLSFLECFFPINRFSLLFNFIQPRFLQATFLISSLQNCDHFHRLLLVLKLILGRFKGSFLAVGLVCLSGVLVGQPQLRVKFLSAHIFMLYFFFPFIAKFIFGCFALLLFPVLYFFPFLLFVALLACNFDLLFLFPFLFQFFFFFNLIFLPFLVGYIAVETFPGCLSVNMVAD